MAVSGLLNIHDNQFIKGLGVNKVLNVPFELEKPYFQKADLSKMGNLQNYPNLTLCLL
jgi:hypothetical protein